MREDLAKELEKIGLSENEAKVYLAGLELGPSTAQMIAAKATVSRPTTYIMIESLIKRGLMSSFQKGKKRYFVASAPHQILYIVSAQKQVLSEREKRLKEIISELDQLVGEKGSGPDITVYEGVDGLNAFQRDLLDSDAKEIYELTSVDKVRKFLPPKYSGDKREDIGRKFKIKSLYTASEGPVRDTAPYVESKLLDFRKFDIRGEIIIFGDRISLISYGSKLLNITIRNSDIAATIKTLFLGLWNTQ